MTKASAAMMLFSLGLASAWAVDARLGAIYADASALTKAVDAGRKTATFCFNCHGNDGNSKLPEVPNLAAQNAGYLLVQIGKFVSGERRDPFMQGLMKALSAEERVNIAVFFAEQDRKVIARAAPTNPAGKALFEKVCVACHGAAGLGNDTIPRIANQQPAYVVKSLSLYRQRNGARGDPQMSVVAAKLSDADIRVLADYVAGM
jgi:cytochrome c553